jgi:hypothetical protein
MTEPPENSTNSENPPSNEPRLVPRGKVRKVGAFFLVISVLEILVCHGGYLVDVIPAEWLGYFLGALSLSVVLLPGLWQKRITRRLKDVSDGNWSGRQR